MCHFVGNVLFAGWCEQSCSGQEIYIKTAHGEPGFSRQMNDQSA
jgi:hypothetical protein